MDLYLGKGEQVQVLFLAAIMTKGIIFNFDSANYLYLDTSITEGPADGVYISRLEALITCCVNCDDFNLLHKLLVHKIV